MERALRDRPHHFVAATARELQSKSKDERSAVLSTALSFLRLYRDPVVAEVTSVSDLTVEGLVTGERSMSLDLVRPPSDVSRTKPLMRLVLNQIARRLTEQEPDPSRRKYPLTLDVYRKSAWWGLQPPDDG